MRQSPRNIRKKYSFQMTAPQLEAPMIPLPVVEETGEERVAAPCGPLQSSSTVRSPSRRLWKGMQQVQIIYRRFQRPYAVLSHGFFFSPCSAISLKTPRFTKSDLNLLQLIKAGKEGIFYQARMSRGTCKGHSMFTCKISKEGR